MRVLDKEMKAMNRLVSMDLIYNIQETEEGGKDYQMRR